MSRVVLVLGDALGDVLEEVGDAERAAVVERDPGEVRVMRRYELESCAVVFDGAAYVGARVVSRTDGQSDDYKAVWECVYRADDSVVHPLVIGVFDLLGIEVRVPRLVGEGPSALGVYPSTETWSCLRLW